MKPRFGILCVFSALGIFGYAAAAPTSGELLPGTPPGLTMWWTFSSAAKIRPDSATPAKIGASMIMESARNETEAAQLVVRSPKSLSGVRLTAKPLTHSDGAHAINPEILKVKYLEIQQPTDDSSAAGLWPDPLLTMDGPLQLAADMNHVFWIRVFVPKDSPSGSYTGTVQLVSQEFSAEVPVELQVYEFTLPDRKSCATAFGFSAEEVFRYHGLKTESDKRLVLEKYLKNMAVHHISPYNPAPLDRFKVEWPQVQPPRSAWADWTGLRVVTNEVHSGSGALLVYDDQPGLNVTVGFAPLIPIAPGGLEFTAWYRTAVPGHRFLISFNHYDKDGQWMSGRNNDIAIAGTGQWQQFQRPLTTFPEGAAFVRLHLRATLWTDNGENIGLVWLDDLSLREKSTGRELLTAGDFEREVRTNLVTAPENLRVRFDFFDWDKAMERALDQYHFTSFQVPYPGLGGGTFHALTPPSLLGFTEEDPEYPLLLGSYGRQLEQHLQERGWLDRAFVYWFDEPSPDQYPFVMNGFAKLKKYSPGIMRMLTEQVEPELIGGPNLWCPISNEYNHERAQARREAGDKIWWYVCTGPKAPYAGLFIDHPAPEMRIWVWQAWERGIEGLLVWQINYWTSDAAYPDKDTPQNPYTDPMSWTSGYSTPAGQRLPWGNGDGRFLYPPLTAADGKPSKPILDGPEDSIRWEHLRDGIEDYEYLCLLRDRLDQNPSRLPATETETLSRLLKVPAEITKSLTEFTSHGTPIEARRRLIAQAIEKLPPAED